jgi:hypothetical protein
MTASDAHHMTWRRIKKLPSRLDKNSMRVLRPSSTATAMVRQNGFFRYNRLPPSNSLYLASSGDV